jgi:hypothetical protein
MACDTRKLCMGTFVPHDQGDVILVGAGTGSENSLSLSKPGA